MESGRRDSRLRHLSEYHNSEQQQQQQFFKYLYLLLCAQAPVEAGEHVESPGAGAPGAMSCLTWMLPRELGALQE